MGPVINSGAGGSAASPAGGGSGGHGGGAMPSSGTPSENETNNIIHKLMCHRQVCIYCLHPNLSLDSGWRGRILCEASDRIPGKEAERQARGAGLASPRHYVIGRFKYGLCQYSTHAGRAASGGGTERLSPYHLLKIMALS